MKLLKKNKGKIIALISVLLLTVKLLNAV